VEEFEIAEDVGSDFLWLGFGIEGLEFSDDLLDGMITVAALDDFQAGADEAEGAFWHEEHALLIVFAEADAGGEAGFGVRIRVGHRVLLWRRENRFVVPGWARGASTLSSRKEVSKFSDRPVSILRGLHMI